MINFEKCPKKRLIYFTFFIIFVFSFEYFTREILWDLTIYITPWMQKNLQIFIPFEHFLSFFGTERVMIVCIFIIFLFFNIYKTFILIAVISSANLLTGLLKMIYTQPRPFWVSDDIIPYQCEGGWACPSGHSLCSVAFYLTFWRLIFNKEDDKQKHIRILTFSIIITIISLICSGRVFLGVHAINQVFLGCCLGWSLFYFTFNILHVDPDDPYQLFYIITETFKKFYLVNLGMFVIYTIIYFIVSNLNTNKLKYNQIINSKGCFEIGNSKRFENDAYLSCTIFHLYLAALIGIKLEYSRIFNSNLKKWMEYNFGIFITAEQQSLLHKNVDCQWNHTKDNSITVKRCILTIIYLFVTMIPYLFINNDSNLIIVVLFKIIIPFVTSLIMLFSYFKVFLAYTNATNENTNYSLCYHEMSTEIKFSQTWRI